jgi:YD repeat-containing protein
VIPPEGGVTSTAITDVRGRNTEIRQYTAAPTISGSVVSGGDFETTGLRYTPLGQLESMTDAAGNKWSYTYDLLGRQTSATDPDSGASSSTYDLTGLLTSTTDARGQTIAYAYDELGRETAEHSGSLTGTKLAAWFYDTASNGVGLPAYKVRYTAQGNYRSAAGRSRVLPTRCSVAMGLSNVVSAIDQPHRTCHAPWQGFTHSSDALIVIAHA